MASSFSRPSIRNLSLQSLPPARGDKQEHAVPVRKLDRFRAGLGIADGYIGQSHGFPSLSGVCPPNIPPSVGVLSWPFCIYPPITPQKLAAGRGRGGMLAA